MGTVPGTVPTAVSGMSTYVSFITTNTLCFQDLCRVEFTQVLRSLLMARFDTMSHSGPAGLEVPKGSFRLTSSVDKRQARTLHHRWRCYAQLAPSLGDVSIFMGARGSPCESGP